MLLLYILWDDWPIFMISASNEQLQQQLEYNLLKPDCHSWWISKMQSGREDTLEERYAMKFCFKLGKMPPKKRMECFRLLFDHLSWIEHRFLSVIRDSSRAENLWGVMGGVGGVRKSVHQSRSVKRLGLGLGLLCWGFKGVQKKIPSEESNTLQIGSVVFPPGHSLVNNSILVTDYLAKMGIKTVLQRPIVQTLLPVTFEYFLSPEAAVMRQIRRWKRLWRRSLTHSY